jgi:UPF0716 protein FxsA
MFLRFSLFLPAILFVLLEIYVLIRVGEAIGAVWAIFLIVFTSVLGVLLMRFQGFYTLQQAQRAVQKGEMPAVQMLEGVVLFFGGILLLLPGFVTDFLGLLTLFGPLRRALIKRFIRSFMPPGPPPGSGDTDSGHGTTIEGEYRRED